MQNAFYEERLYAPWNILIIGTVALASLAVLVWQLVAGSPGTQPAPDWGNWFLAGVALLFLALWVNFAALTIRVTTQGVSVGYGIIWHRIPWHNVSGCSLDEASMARYGGWGIRVGWAGGKRRLAFTTPGVPRVVIEKGQGYCSEFAFSTWNPEGVMRAVREGLGRA